MRDAFICSVFLSEPKASGHCVEDVFCVVSGREKHVDRVDQARGCRLLDRGLQLLLPGARCRCDVALSCGSIDFLELRKPKA